ncbi:hypothetical protein C2845_PMPSC055709 [Panicum miliaceum]|uniref:DUF8039 domain-containing protein n=1 Tax=Panicum miliaceum TaxID=4540 RepID=A0A3L6PC99_PANMI|nr:hypothetical protein C2845_PMPSC055709 [Panicum miliaceum]
MSKVIKDKHEASQSSGTTWVRENDLLTSCLGPEQPGRVRGMSSYNGWKHAWPEFSGMYRKRKRTGSVDVEAIKSELRAEVTNDIISMLAAQGIQLQLPPTSRNQSPTPGRRSSCASASEAENLNINDANPDQMQEDVKLDTTDVMDTIDQLTEPTPCSLVGTHGGYQVEVARGLVYPQQTILHSVPVLYGYAVVKVEMVCNNSEGDVLDPPPPNDEIKTLGQAMLQRIQWKRSHIIVNPPPIDHTSSKSSKVASKSPSSASLSGHALPPKEPVIQTKSCTVLPSMEEVVASNSSKKDAGKSVPKQQQNVACRTYAAAKTTKKIATSSQRQQQQVSEAAVMTTKKPAASSQK